MSTFKTLEARYETRALPFCGEPTMFYGTHLKQQKRSTHPKIRYVEPGESIEIV